MEKIKLNTLVYTKILFVLGAIVCLGYNSNKLLVKQKPENKEKIKLKFVQAEKATVYFEVRDKNTEHCIPGKIMVLQNGQVVDLMVEPHEFLAARGNIIYTANGKGSFEIKPGKYDFWFGRGLEYSADLKKVNIKAGQKYKIIGKLEKMVKTPGYIGGDMHLHTLTYSGHGDANVGERVISSLAEGLDWIVSTEHNYYVTEYPTDYQPVVRKLGISDQIATTVGTEISTPIGHFNIFPIDSEEKQVKNNNKDAKELFRLIRASTDDPVVIQVNHPRWPGLDYFGQKNLDPYLGVSNDSTWSWDFDIIEILNGHSGYDNWIVGPQNPIPVKTDWYNMLNNGRKFVGVGNSDSHTVKEAFVGIPRNYIASSTDKSANIDENELIRNIKKGNLSVSRGLYIEMSTDNGSPIGSTVKTDSGNVNFHIKVQAANWIDCDSVYVVENGLIIQKYAVPDSEGAVRFDEMVIVQPEKDSWYLVVAKGNEPMKPLYKEFTPLAFTNPIWVNIDESGEMACATTTK